MILEQSLTFWDVDRTLNKTQIRLWFGSLFPVLTLHRHKEISVISVKQQSRYEQSANDFQVRKAWNTRNEWQSEKSKQAGAFKCQFLMSHNENNFLIKIEKTPCTWNEMVILESMQKIFFYSRYLLHHHAFSVFLMWLYSYGPKKLLVLGNMIFKVTKRMWWTYWPAFDFWELQLNYLKFYKTSPGLMAKIILS